MDVPIERMNHLPHDPECSSSPPGMQGAQHARLREACFVPLDPVLDGFHGVVVELYEQIETEAASGAVRPTRHYMIVQSAALSGNLITRMRCKDEGGARELYHELCESGVYPTS